MTASHHESTGSDDTQFPPALPGESVSPEAERAEAEKIYAAELARHEAVSLTARYLDLIAHATDDVAEILDMARQEAAVDRITAAQLQEIEAFADYDSFKAAIDHLANKARPNQGRAITPIEQMLIDKQVDDPYNPKPPTEEQAIESVILGGQKTLDGDPKFDIKNRVALLLAKKLLESTSQKTIKPIAKQIADISAKEAFDKDRGLPMSQEEVDELFRLYKYLKDSLPRY